MEDGALAVALECGVYVWEGCDGNTPMLILVESAPFGYLFTKYSLV